MPWSIKTISAVGTGLELTEAAHTPEPANCDKNLPPAAIPTKYRTDRATSLQEGRHHHSGVQAQLSEECSLLDVLASLHTRRSEHSDQHHLVLPS